MLSNEPLDIGVIVAAIIFLKVDSPKRFYADPAASLAISLIIFYSAIPMSMYNIYSSTEVPLILFINSTVALKSGRILLEASPNHLDLGKVKEDLLSVSFFFSCMKFYSTCLKLKPPDSWCTCDTWSPCLEPVPIVSTVRCKITFIHYLNILSHPF